MGKGLRWVMWLQDSEFLGICSPVVTIYIQVHWNPGEVSVPADLVPALFSSLLFFLWLLWINQNWFNNWIDLTIDVFMRFSFLKIHPEAVAATQLNTLTAGMETGKYINT